MSDAAWADDDLRYHTCDECGAREDCAADCPNVLAMRASCPHAQGGPGGRCGACGGRADDPTGVQEAAEAVAARTQRRAWVDPISEDVATLATALVAERAAAAEAQQAQREVADGLLRTLRAERAAHQATTERLARAEQERDDAAEERDAVQHNNLLLLEDVARAEQAATVPHATWAADVRRLLSYARHHDYCGAPNGHACSCGLDMDRAAFSPALAPERATEVTRD